MPQTGGVVAVAEGVVCRSLLRPLHNHAAIPPGWCSQTGRFHEGWMREEAKRQVSTAAAENPDVGERYTLNGMLRVPGFSPTDLFALTFPQVTGQTVESAADVMGR